jgi:hypothetical protein
VVFFLLALSRTRDFCLIETFPITFPPIYISPWTFRSDHISTHDMTIYRFITWWPSPPIFRHGAFYFTHISSHGIPCYKIYISSHSISYYIHYTLQDFLLQTFYFTTFLVKETSSHNNSYHDVSRDGHIRFLYVRNCNFTPLRKHLRSFISDAF